MSNRVPEGFVPLSASIGASSSITVWRLGRRRRVLEASSQDQAADEDSIRLAADFVKESPRSPRGHRDNAVPVDAFVTRVNESPNPHPSQSGWPASDLRTDKRAVGASAPIRRRLASPAAGLVDSGGESLPMSSLGRIAHLWRRFVLLAGILDLARRNGVRTASDRMTAGRSGVTLRPRPQVALERIAVTASGRPPSTSTYEAFRYRPAVSGRAPFLVLSEAAT